MSLADQVLAVNNDLPIRTDQPIHSGKVRSVYWLSEADSDRLIAEKGYNVAPGSPLAIMVISDRISAFECIWHGEGGMNGVPGKGAALNAISNHWFRLFREKGLADSHILDIPHPLVWIVQKAQPVMIEAIARQYITGSMWRSLFKYPPTKTRLPMLAPFRSKLSGMACWKKRSKYWTPNRKHAKNAQNWSNCAYRSKARFTVVSWGPWITA